eukprot:1159343-Pelagomonas_calceolata.AAC.9
MLGWILRQRNMFAGFEAKKEIRGRTGKQVKQAVLLISVAHTAQLRVSQMGKKDKRKKNLGANATQLSVGKTERGK